VQQAAKAKRKVTQRSDGLGCQNEQNASHAQAEAAEAATRRLDTDMKQRQRAARATCHLLRRLTDPSSSSGSEPSWCPSPSGNLAGALSSLLESSTTSASAHVPINPSSPASPALRISLATAEEKATVCRVLALVDQMGAALPRESMGTDTPANLDEGQRNSVASACMGLQWSDEEVTRAQKLHSIASALRESLAIALPHTSFPCGTSPRKAPSASSLAQVGTIRSCRTSRQIGFVQRRGEKYPAGMSIASLPTTQARDVPSSLPHESGPRRAEPRLPSPHARCGDHLDVSDIKGSRRMGTPSRVTRRLPKSKLAAALQPSHVTASEVFVQVDFAQAAEATDDPAFDLSRKGDEFGTARRDLPSDEGVQMLQTVDKDAQHTASAGASDGLPGPSLRDPAVQDNIVLSNAALQTALRLDPELRDLLGVDSEVPVCATGSGTATDRPEAAGHSISDTPSVEGGACLQRNAR
jgi:hypothetical protein